MDRHQDHDVLKNGQLHLFRHWHGDIDEHVGEFTEPLTAIATSLNGEMIEADEVFDGIGDLEDSVDNLFTLGAEFMPIMSIGAHMFRDFCLNMA